MIVKMDNVQVLFKFNKVEDTMAGTTIKITKGFFIPPVKNNKRLS